MGRLKVVFYGWMTYGAEVMSALFYSVGDENGDRIIVTRKKQLVWCVIKKIFLYLQQQQQQQQVRINPL
jgi:hypothetical protein